MWLFPGTVLSKFEDPLGRYLILKALSFCVVGRLGRKEKRALGARWEGEREKRGSRLFPLPIVPGALSIFSIIAMGIISWSLCEGESPEGGDQGQIVCAENIYAPTKDKVIIKFLNNLRTILQKENLDDEENIIIRSDFNYPLNSALDKKKVVQCYQGNQLLKPLIVYVTNLIWLTFEERKSFSKKLHVEPKLANDFMPLGQLADYKYLQDSITVTTMQSFPWILILVKTTLLFPSRWR